MVGLTPTYTSFKPQYAQNGIRSSRTNIIENYTTRTHTHTHINITPLEREKHEKKWSYLSACDENMYKTCNKNCFIFLKIKQNLQNMNNNNNNKKSLNPYPNPIHSHFRQSHTQIYMDEAIKNKTENI